MKEAKTMWETEELDTCKKRRKHAPGARKKKNKVCRIHKEEKEEIEVDWKKTMAETQC